MRKLYTLKAPMRRDGKVVAKTGTPVPLTRSQFEALHAQGQIDKPVKPAEAWPEPAPRKGAAAAAQPATPAKPEA